MRSDYLLPFPIAPPASSSINQVSVLYRRSPMFSPKVSSSGAMAKFSFVFFVFLSLFLVSHARIKSDSFVEEGLLTSTSPENDQKTDLLHPKNQKPKTIKSNPFVSSASEAIAISSFRPLKLGHSFLLVNRRFPDPKAVHFRHRCGHHKDFRRGEGHRFQIPGRKDVADVDRTRILNKKGGMDLDASQIILGEEIPQIPFREDMIDRHSAQIPVRRYEFPGERVVARDEEKGGFWRWFQDLMNYF